MEIRRGDTFTTVVFDGAIAYCRITEKGRKPRRIVVERETKDKVITDTLTLIFKKE